MSVPSPLPHSDYPSHVIRVRLSESGYPFASLSESDYPSGSGYPSQVVRSSHIIRVRISESYYPSQAIRLRQAIRVGLSESAFGVRFSESPGAGAAEGGRARACPSRCRSRRVPPHPHQGGGWVGGWVDGRARGRARLSESLSVPSPLSHVPLRPPIPCPPRPPHPPHTHTHTHARAHTRTRTHTHKHTGTLG